MKWFDRLEEWVIGVLLAAMTALTFVQVVLRYVFNTGLTWAQELTGVFFAFMIFAGLGYGVRVGAHIGVDAVVRLLGHGPRRAVSIVAVLLCLGYCALVLVGSSEYVLKMRDIGVELEDLPIERWQVLIVLPLGFAWLAWRFVQVLWGLWSGRLDSLHLADESAEALKLRAQEENRA